MPDSNEAAGLSAAETYFGTSVKRIAINHQGVIRVGFDAEIGARSMVFEPVAVLDSGILSWRCTSDSLAPAVLEKLRPACTHVPSTPERQLALAIAKGSVAQVEHLLAGEVDIHAEVHGSTAMQLATNLGQPEIIFLLQAYDTDTPPSLLGGEYWVPEDNLIDEGQRRRIASSDHPCLRSGRSLGDLLVTDASEDRVSRNTSSALATAIACERPDLAQQLVRAGASVNAKTSSGSYPIIEAAKKANTQLVAQLVQAGAEVNVTDQLGRTAAVAAVAQGEESLVGVLLEAGADPRLRDKNGISALMLAQSEGHKKIQSLIETVQRPVLHDP